MGSTWMRVVLAALLIGSVGQAWEASAVTKLYVTHEAIDTMSQELHSKVVASGYTPDLLVGIARGGLGPLLYLSNEKMFDMRHALTVAVKSYEGMHQSELEVVFPLPRAEDLAAYKSVLLIDDLADSGKTLAFMRAKLMELLPQATIKTATLYYKKHSVIVPDYYVAETDAWVVFPWEAK